MGEQESSPLPPTKLPEKGTLRLFFNSYKIFPPKLYQGLVGSGGQDTRIGIKTFGPLTPKHTLTPSESKILSSSLANLALQAV